MYFQTEADWLTYGVAIKAYTLSDGVTVVDERVTTGVYNGPDAVSGWTPGYHLEASTGSSGNHVLSIFSGCSTAPGSCDETNRQDHITTYFKFMLHAQEILRPNLIWTLVDSLDSDGLTTRTDSAGSIVTKRSASGAMVTVQDRYIVGVGGPSWNSGSGAGARITVYDTSTLIEYTHTADEDVDKLEFPAIAAWDDYACSSCPDTIVGAFLITGGRVSSAFSPSTTTQEQQAYNVYLGKIDLTSGVITVSISLLYAYDSSTIDSSMPARFGSVAWVIGNSFMIQGGFHLGSHTLDEYATDCTADATGRVWAFDAGLTDAGVLASTAPWSLVAEAPEATTTACTTSEVDAAGIEGGLGRGRHAATLVGTTSVRISGGLRHASSTPAFVSSLYDQWELDLATYTWTQYTATSWSSESVPSDRNRWDHAMVTLGESRVVVAGGNCLTDAHCVSEYVFTQPSGTAAFVDEFGEQSDTEYSALTVDDRISLATAPTGLARESFSESSVGVGTSSRTVLCGTHLYTFSLVDPTSESSVAPGGLVWRYKLVSYVSPTGSNTKYSTDEFHGSSTSPFQTISYAVNRGFAPVTVLMSGSHTDIAGSNDIHVAGPLVISSATYLASTAAGYPTTCSMNVNAATTASEAAVWRQTCVGPVVVTGQAGAVVAASGLQGGFIITGGVKVLLDNFEISGAFAESGGAIYADNLEWHDYNDNTDGSALVFLQRMTLTDSTSLKAGGAIFTKRNMHVFKTTISNCAAVLYGGCVYFEDDTTQPLLMDEVTIVGGDLSAANSGFAAGINQGGLIYSTGTIEIVNSALSGGYAKHGGGINLEGTTSVVSFLTDSTISGCYAVSNEGLGGGIYISQNDLFYAVDKYDDYNRRGLQAWSSTITGNNAFAGGGVFMNRGLMMFYGCTLSSNYATDEGGGLFASASIVGIWSSSSVNNNNANRDGGGVLVTLSTLYVLESTFDSNYGLRGAAIRSRDCRAEIGGNNVVIEDSTIQNHFSFSAGAVFSEDTTTQHIDTTFDNNIAYRIGGAVYTRGLTYLHSYGSTYKYNYGLYGGGLALMGRTAAISTATISNNWAFRDGGGVLLESMASVTFYSCTISGNTALTGYGGGVSLYGGGRSNDVGTLPLVTLSTSTISGNNAQYGGGLAEICEEDDYDQYFGTCAQYFLQTDNTITSNGAWSAGGGVYWATNPPIACFCGACTTTAIAQEIHVDATLPCNDLSGNQVYEDTYGSYVYTDDGFVIDYIVAYGPEIASATAAYVAVGEEANTVFAPGVVSETPIVVTLVDVYGQTVTSGSTSNATVWATYPDGVTMTSGGMTDLYRGTGSIYLGFVAEAGTYDIEFVFQNDMETVSSFNLMNTIYSNYYGFLYSGPLETTGTMSVTITSCELGYFLNAANSCEGCGEGHYSPAGAVAGVCYECPAGYFNDDESASGPSCTPCPAGYFLATTGGQSQAECTQCSSVSVSAMGSKTCTVCGPGLTPNSKKDACETSEDVYIVVVSLICALIVAMIVYCCVQFRPGDKKVKIIMRQMRESQGKGLIDSAAERERVAAQSMDDLTREVKVTAAASSAVDAAARASVAVAALLTGLDAETLANDIAPVVSSQRRAVESAVNQMTYTWGADGTSITKSEENEIMAAVDVAVKAVCTATQQAADADAAGTLEAVAEVTDKSLSKKLSARVAKANDIENDVTAAICMAAHLDAIEAVNEAKEVLLTLPKGPQFDAHKLKYQEALEAIEERINLTALARRYATQARINRRGINPAPAPGTPEAASEAKTDIEECYHFIAGIESTLQMLSKVSEKNAAIARAKAKLGPMITNTANKCRTKIDAAYGARKAKALEEDFPMTDPVGVIALESIMESTLHMQRLSAEAAVGLALAIHPGKFSDANLTVAVQAEALAGRALPAAQMAMSRHMADAFDAQGMDPFEAAKHAADLATSLESMHDKFETISARRHGALMKMIIDAANLNGPPNDADVEAATASATATLEGDFKEAAESVLAIQHPEGIEPEASKDLTEDQNQVANDLSQAAQTSLADEIAALSASQAKEADERNAALEQLANLDLADAHAQEMLQKLTAKVIAAGFEGRDYEKFDGVASILNQAQAGMALNFANARSDLDAQTMAMSRQLEKSAARHNQDLSDRLTKREETGPQKKLGFFGRTKEAARERAVAATISKQIALAGGTKGMDKEAISAMMKEHVDKLVAMNNKLEDVNKSKHDNLMARLAKKKAGNQVAPV